MKIDSLRQLDRLMAICRKRGVTSIKIDGIEFLLTEDAPQKAVKRTLQATTDSTGTIETPDALTPEDALFWSASGQVPPNGDL